MTIYRGAGSGDAVVVILRAAAQDNRISLRALGVLTNVMSRPDDWRTTGAHLAEQRPEGRDAVLKALAELERYGYLQRVTRRRSNGQLVKVWEMTDDPTLLRRHPPKNGKPGVGGPGHGRPGTGAPGPRKPGRGRPGTGAPGIAAPGIAAPGDGRPAIGGSGEVLRRETEGETPPPTPAAEEDEHGLAVDELERVVVGAIRGRCPTPSRTVLHRELSRLARLQWTAAQLHAAVEGHDWSGARAGAVISHLRQLQAPGMAPEAVQERPTHCGACDPVTRLLEDPETHVPRRCPTCHPSTRRDTA